MQDKSNDILNTLEQGVKNVFSSDRYFEYLTFLSKFHNYSWRNTVLIFSQNPEATLVAGFNDWKNKHKRYVKKGEKAIRIIAPYFKKFEAEIPVLDNNGNSVVINGKVLTEKKEIEKMLFRAVSVFDVSQTNGEPIPQLTNELKDTVANYQELFTAISSFSDYPIEFEDISGSAKGYFSFVEQRIAINNGMSESQTIKTAIHELTHSRLHNNLNQEEQNKVSRATAEVQAESVAFVVANHFGIDTSDYSFDYIANWSSGKELEELHESLEIIQREANIIIKGIEEQYKQLLKDRNVEAEINNADKGFDRDMDGIDDSRDSGYSDSNLVPDINSEYQHNTFLISQDQARLIQEYFNIPMSIYGDEGCFRIIENFNVIDDPELRDKTFDSYLFGSVNSNTPVEISKQDWNNIKQYFVEPHIFIEWSESDKVPQKQILTLSEANALFESADLATVEEYAGCGGYDKTKFALFYAEGNAAKILVDRQDFGDGDGSLINHIKTFNPDLANVLDVHVLISQLNDIPSINRTELLAIRDKLNTQPQSLEALINIRQELLDVIKEAQAAAQLNTSKTSEAEKGSKKDTHSTQGRKSHSKHEYSKEENNRIISDIKQSIPIHEYAQQIGFTIQRAGSYYTLKEHDSVRIDPNKNVFVQNSTGTKGSIIDFVMHFENLDKSAAIDKLAKYINADKSTLSTPNQNHLKFSAERADNVPLILPDKAKTMKNVFAYLINTRKIDSKIVNQWVKNKNLYQDTHNNCVFVTYDNNGKANFVSQKGTNTSKPFQADIKGSDYNCCHFINNNAKSLIVCEAVIDLMSVQTILKANGRDLNNYNYLSLNGVSKTQAIINALNTCNTDTVILATDNDKAGEQARTELRKLANELANFKFIDFVPKNEKDWNAELVANVQRETALSQSNSKQKLSDRIEDCQNKANEHNKMIDNNKSQSLAQKRNVPDL